MEYYYVTCGRVYRLPTRTLEVDEAIDRIVTGEDRLRAGEITRRQLRGEQRDFIMDAWKNLEDTARICTGQAHGKGEPRYVLSISSQWEKLTENTIKNF